MNTLVPKKLVRSLVASHAHLETWTRTDESKQSELTLDIENIISKNILEIKTFLTNHLNGSMSVTAEFLQKVKKMTLKDKSFTVKKNIQPTLLSKILDQDLTLEEKVYKPFWNTHLADVSTKLWLPTKTDCVDLGLNCSKMFLNDKAMLRSWFSTKVMEHQNPNLSPIYSKFSQSLVTKSMDLENISCLSKKIKIYPNQKQRKILKNYIGCYRKIYNTTVNHIKNLPREKVFSEDKNGSYLKINDKYLFVGKGLGNYKLTNSLVPVYYTNSKGEKARVNQTSLQTMRPIIKATMNEFEWFRNLQIPVHLIDRAVDECSKNFSTVIEKIKTTGKFHELGFKSKKMSITETIDIEAGMISKKRNTIFATKIGQVKSQEDFYQPKRMAKLQYNRITKEWFIIFSNDSGEIPTNQKYDVCSIDPGEKIFLSLYCPDGHIVSICENNRKSKVFHKLKRLDKLISKRTGMSKQKRTSITRAIHRIYKKVKNMKFDLHHKASLFICKNYKNIVFPPYESKSMLSNLNNKVCRSMLTLSYYQFRKKLEYKSKIYGNNLFLVDEKHTTVSCGMCGTYNEPKDREYFCRSCNTMIHRDYNAARNILLKHL